MVTSAVRFPAGFAARLPDRRSAWTARGLRVGAVALMTLLAGCSSVGVGIGIPGIPGVSVGVGVGRGGVTAGVGVGAGPVGAGVGINQNGQVTGGVGVGASAPIGNSNARVGVGVGTGTVLYDPKRPPPPAGTGAKPLSPAADPAGP